MGQPERSTVAGCAAVRDQQSLNGNYKENTNLINVNEIIVEKEREYLLLLDLVVYSDHMSPFAWAFLTYVCKN